MSEWPEIRLDKCCEIVSGSTPRRDHPEYWSGDIAWVTPKDLRDLEGPVLADTPERITRAGYESCSTRLLPVGSVLFSSRAPIGLVAITGCEMCTNQGFKSLIPGADVDAGYLYWCLKRQAPRIADQSSGTTFSEVSRKGMERVKIPLPPLPEQRRIAAILDQADAVRGKRQHTLDLANQFLRSAFLDMFGDPVTNPKGWPTEELERIASITTGNTPPRKKPEYYGSGIEWIKSDNINTPSHFLTPADECLTIEGKEHGRMVGTGATLMTCIAGSRSCIGNVALTDRGVAFNQQINAITPGEGLEPDFLYAELLHAKRLIQAASTDSMKGLVSKGRLAQVRIPVPPMSLQRSFSSIFRAMLRWTGNLEKAQSEAETCFNSLIQRAFRGEL